MSEKGSVWRRSFRSKKTSDKRQKKHSACGPVEPSDMECKGGVSGPGPGLEAAGGSGHDGKAQEKKSKTLGVMRKLFGKLGKVRHKSKDVKPEGPVELADAPTHAQVEAASGGNQSQMSSSNRQNKEQEAEKKRYTSQIPQPITNGRSASPRSHRRTSPAISDRSQSTEHPSGPLSTDLKDQSRLGLQCQRTTQLEPGPDLRNQFTREIPPAPYSLSKGKASPLSQRVQTKSPVVVHLEKYSSSPQSQLKTYSQRREPIEKQQSHLNLPKGANSEIDIVAHHSVVSGHSPGAGRSQHTICQKSHPTKPSAISAPKQQLHSPYRADPGRLPLPGSTPMQPTLPEHVPDDVTTTSNRSDIGAELNFKFIDNESDEEDREHSLSFRNRRDDKLSKSIERIAGKFRDLPPAFLNLLEAPLPARPWHPEVTSSKRPENDGQNMRPIAKPTQVHRKQSPPPAASSPETPPASVIHYHVTIQNCDGMDVNVSPMNEGDNPKDIATKTVYTADGRQLKRLSWVEVSPINWKAEEGRISADTNQQTKTSSTMEIGSVGLTLGIDKNRSNEEGKAYVSEEADELFSGEGEVHIAAPVPQTSYGKQTTSDSRSLGGLSQVKQEIPPDECSGSLEWNTTNSSNDKINESKSDFPWHSSRRVSSASSLSDDQQMEVERRSRPTSTLSINETCNDITFKPNNAPSLNKKHNQARSSKNPVSIHPRPNFKPGQKRAAQEEAATNSKSSEQSSESSPSLSGIQSNKKRERRRRSNTSCPNGKNGQDTEERTSPGGAKVSSTSSQKEKCDSSSQTTSGRNVNPSSQSKKIIIEESAVRPESKTVKESGAQTDSDLAQSCPSDSKVATAPSPLQEHYLCTNCRNLKKRLSSGKCTHTIPSDIVAKRKADFDKLLDRDGEDSTHSDVTAMRVGPQTTFFKNAQCQTYTEKSADSNLATQLKERSQNSERRSRPVGRVVPNMRRSASAHSPTRLREIQDVRVGRWGLQRHWSFSSVDTEIHPSYQNLSSHSSTSSMDWETTSVDTDILTLETDRTLMETERTLREVEQSIEESRRASRALRRARRELESDVPAASRRGVSLDRGTSDRGFGTSHSFDSRPIMSFTNVPVQAHIISHNRGISPIGTLHTGPHQRETTHDKLTRIRKNLIRVPGVLILGLHGGKIAVTMSPDRPHFEPIYRFMRENDVYMTEYECAVLSQRYRTSRLDGATVIQHAMVSPVLVR